MAWAFMTTKLEVYNEWRMAAIKKGGYMHDCQSEGKPIDGSTMTSASVILPFLVIVMSGEEEGCNIRRWLAPGNNPLCGCVGVGLFSEHSFLKDYYLQCVQ